MKKIEDCLTTAFAALCAVSVSGPAVVPMGKAIEAINGALEEIRRMEERTESAVHGPSARSGLGPEKAGLTEEKETTS